MTPGTALLVDEDVGAIAFPDVAPELVSVEGVTVGAVDARAPLRGASSVLVVGNFVTGRAGVGFPFGRMGASRFEVARVWFFLCVMVDC